MTTAATAVAGGVRAGAASRHGEERRGLLLGLAGVLVFSLTLPMTRLAVAQIDPWLVAFGRMAVAGLLSALWLALTRCPWPTRAQCALLAASALGVVLGFPLFTSLAMRSVAANHGAVVVGVQPFVTALAATLAFGERHRPRFWVAAAAGSLLVVGFALRAGAGSLGGGDAWLLAAVLIGGTGYACGGRVARDLGGSQAILWALALAAPFTVPIAAGLAIAAPPTASWPAWGAFAYVTLGSQLIGFFAWYGGLARGGIARVGQVQLLQVFFTLGFASIFFGEQVAPSTWLFAAAVAATIAIGRSAERT